MAPHEKLEVYSRSLQLVALAHGLAARVPRGYSALADQLRRAVISIPLNIAEGYARATPDDRRRLYVVARGSANECAALVDVLRIVGIRFNPVSDVDVSAEAKDLACRVAAMLTRLSGF